MSLTVCSLIHREISAALVVVAAVLARLVAVVSESVEEDITVYVLLPDVEPEPEPEA